MEIKQNIINTQNKNYKWENMNQKHIFYSTYSNQFKIKQSIKQI